MKRRAGGAAAHVVVTLAAGMWAGCSLEDRSAPALTAPSEFGTSISLTASPDQLPRDGRAQSTVTVTVRDGSNRPVPGQRLNVAVDVGRVAPSEVVTGSDGRASLSFTAPPPGTVGNEALVRVTPIGSGADGAVSRVVTIPFTGARNATRPTPEFTYTPPGPQIGQLVTFDASATTDEGPTTPCADACTYSWNFDSGASGTGQVVTHRFAVARSHTVTLTVTDAAGTVAGLSKVVTVAAIAAPTVRITVDPSPPTAGQRVTLTATATAGTGHSIQTFSWDFGDGTTQMTASPTVTTTYRAPGTYTATVTVTDDLGQTGSGSVSLTVASGITFPSTAPFTISPTSPRVGDVVRFGGGDVTASNGATIVEFTWDFGDGSAAVAGGDPTATHSYTQARTYVVRLTVRDSQGRTATRTRDVPIAPAAP